MQSLLMSPVVAVIEFQRWLALVLRAQADKMPSPFPGLCCWPEVDFVKSEKSSVSAMSDVMRIKPGYLLGIYSIIPVVILFIAADLWLNDLQLSRALPADPHSMQWFTMFFMLPHIFASLFTFVDRDYLVAYRDRLVVSVPVILMVVIVVPLLFNAPLLQLIVAVYTLFHLISQQTGIAAMIARNKSAVYHAWKWVSFFAVLMISVLAQANVPGFRDLLYLALPFFILFYGALTLLSARQSKTVAGARYIAANSAMIVICYGLALARLPFFVILIMRVVHDVTAFYFYISHNANRNRERHLNLISRLRKWVRLPEYVFTPLMGVLCTFLATVVLGEGILFAIIFLGLLHYYWEGVMWKQGSPHRASIHV